MSYDGQDEGVSLNNLALYRGVLTKAIKDYQTEMHEVDRAISDRHAKLKRREKAAMEREQFLNEKERRLKEREKNLELLESGYKERHRKIEKREMLLEERERKVEEFSSPRPVNMKREVTLQLKEKHIEQSFRDLQKEKEFLSIGRDQLIQDIKQNQVFLQATLGDLRERAQQEHQNFMDKLLEEVGQFKLPSFKRILPVAEEILKQVGTLEEDCYETMELLNTAKHGKPK